MCKIWEFYVFLLILLVSILFIVSNRFYVTMRKNKLNTVYASDSIQQDRLAVSLKVARIWFYSLDLSMQRRFLLKKEANCQFKSRSVQDSIVLK